MKRLIFVVALFALGIANAQIDQSRGVDQRVEYKALEKLGPWDDRNYQITREDLDLIPEKDQYLANVPAFFKIEMRREMPHLGEFYPRSTYQLFQIRYGGLFRNGVWEKTERGKAWHPGDDPYGKGSDPVTRGGGAPLVPDVEFTLDTGVNGNEVSVEFNPTNPMIGVAGSNRAGGQTMYFSTDGGTTWTQSQVNPSSCCDPTIDWSSDGSRVYQADLSSTIGVRWAVSTDQGQTWGPMQVLTPSGSDKEFIHVDRAAGSAFRDNIYLTYHNGNVMQFARSTDMGATFDTPIAFGAEPTGIGSDITTDGNGVIYYIYPSLNSATGIRLLRSTDGGATFGTSTMIAALNGRFDFPIPAMESREAFIYVSADVDMSGGPRDGRIYVAWTDETDDSFGGGNGPAAQNHGWIEVYYSDDQGASWTRMPHPHDTSDSIAGGDAIDRFHPWLKVAENGVVHIGFYDTRNSTNRTGVDFYYNSSLDGETWEGAQRFSTETSVNINNGQEWGDYNGLSVVMDTLAMTWTDNRPSAGQAAIAGRVTNPSGSDGAIISATPNTASVCTAPQRGGPNALFTINTTAIGMFNGNLDLAFNPALPAGLSSTFTPNPVAAGSPSQLDLQVSGGTAAATLQLTVEGTSAGIDPSTTDITLNIFDQIPAAPTLSMPTDGAVNVLSTDTMFSWNAVAQAETYVLEIATDAGFTNIVSTTMTADTMATVSGVLQSNTEYFWRVRVTNECGTGVNSATFSFTTAPEPGDCPMGVQTNIIYQNDVEGGAAGFTVGGMSGAGGENWTITTTQSNSGASSWFAPDIPEVTDQQLTTPAIDLPDAFEIPITLRYFNRKGLEERAAGGCFDAGILEISANGGAFTQLEGAAILTDPLTGTIDGGFMNPLAGLEGWCDTEPFVESLVDISAFAGQSVRFRFRVGTDSSVGDDGWYIDDIVVQSCGMDPDVVFRDGFE